MYRAITLSLALCCGGAWADGVPLITASKALNATETARLQSDRPSRSAVAVVVNKNALDANIITVAIEGKEYRFIGKKLDTGDGELWSGSAPEGQMYVTRSRMGVAARVEIGSRMFILGPANGQMVLTEAIQKGLDDERDDGKKHPELKRRIKK